jgi:hypothetical protein
MIGVGLADRIAEVTPAAAAATVVLAAGGKGTA